MHVTELSEALRKRPPMGYLVRPMTTHDIHTVGRIERECFPTGWTSTPFRHELHNRAAAYIVACRTEDPMNALDEARQALLRPPMPQQGLISRIANRIHQVIADGPPDDPSNESGIVGFLGLWLPADEAHITTVGVQEQHRRQGVGELLLLSSVELSCARKARVMTLEVRASNRGAQELYKKYGFEAVGVRKRYYTDNHEDALIMTTDVLRETRFQNRLASLQQTHEHHWGPSVRLLAAENEIR